MSPVSQLRRQLARTMIALAALALAVGLVEGAHIGFIWAVNALGRADLVERRRAAAESRGAAEILCVGSSHTASRSWIPGYSFPDQLEQLLRERYPGVSFTVKNAARVGITSEIIMKTLEEELGRSKPKWVVLMLGELQDGRMAEMSGSPQLPEVARPLTGRSRRFPEVPLADVSTLAVKWAGSLSRSFGWRDVLSRATLAEEALGALSAWKPGRSRESERTVYGVHALLLASMRRVPQAEAAVEKLLRASGADYDLFAELSLAELARDPAAIVRPAYARLRQELEARHADPRAISLARLAFSGLDPDSWSAPPGERAALVNEAIRIYPGSMVLHGMLVRLPDKTPYASEVERHARIAEVEAHGYWENPFQPGQLPGPMMAKARPTDADFVPHFNRRFPSLAFSATEAAPVDDTALIQSQLHAAIQLIRSHGALPVLQTYPPHRRDGIGHTSDPLIRAVAEEEKVPLADVYAEVTELAKDGSREKFFEMPGEIVEDDHMNRLGNGVMARQALRVLETSPGWPYRPKGAP